MCQRRTFYILGAGASYGLVPVTQQMRRSVEADYHSVGVYPTVPAARSELFERVIGPIAEYESDISRILLTHIPKAALDLAAQKAIWRPSNGLVPPQYAVFDVVGSPATLCNFNLDGLASNYCGQRHIVLEMHGRIDTRIFELLDYKELLEAAVVYDTQIPHLTPKLMPQVEPESIVRQPEYERASALLCKAPAVVILGYSFGQRSDGLDDRYSFEYFTAILKRTPRPVFVVSPTPRDLAEMLRDTLTANCVFDVPLRWELFSGALLSNVDPVKGMSAQWLRSKLDDVFRSYDIALDAL